MLVAEDSIRRVIKGKGMPLPGDDIDTDRIIPARYLKCVTFDELGKFAFYDERYDEQGNKKDHPFNDERYRGAEILIVNKNFGCGSSREHAPQSLMRAGIRAIIGESFAEIFLGNCTALGIPAVTMETGAVPELMDFIEKEPEVVLTLDLDKKIVEAGLPGGKNGKFFKMEITGSAREVFLSGTWDTTSALLEGKKEIESKARSLPYLNHFLM